LAVAAILSAALPVPVDAPGSVRNVAFEAADQVHPASAEIAIETSAAAAPTARDNSLGGTLTPQVEGCGVVGVWEEGGLGAAGDPHDAAIAAASMAIAARATASLPRTFSIAGARHYSADSARVISIVLASCRRRCEASLTS
jgi:hypothetical protein